MRLPYCGIAGHPNIDHPGCPSPRLPVTAPAPAPSAALERVPLPPPFTLPVDDSALPYEVVMVKPYVPELPPGLAAVGVRSLPQFAVGLRGRTDRIDFEVGKRLKECSVPVRFPTMDVVLPLDVLNFTDPDFHTAYDSRSFRRMRLNAHKIEFFRRLAATGSAEAAARSMVDEGLVQDTLRGRLAARLVRGGGR